MPWRRRWLEDEGDGFPAPPTPHLTLSGLVGGLLLVITGKQRALG